MNPDEGVASARILSYPQAKSRLQKHWVALAQLPHRALDQYKKHIARKLAQPSGRLRSTAIHDFMINELRILFASDVFRKSGRWLLRASQDLVVQFKKVDSSGRTSNYPTATARAFDTQMLFSIFPPGMRVTLGYRLNKTNTEVVEVSLIARDGDQIVWRESLEAQSQLAMPIHAVKKVAVKKFAAKKEATEARGVTTKKNKDKKRGD